MKRAIAAVLIVLLSPAGLASTGRPNVLLVIIDDAGFSDLGAYGGDASTPVLDALAKRGTKLSRFYTSPQCGPTRAMLLTGSDNHEVGIGTINEAMPPDPVLRAHPSYAMKLSPRSETLAERLRAVGYFTLATGKWGLGKPGSSLPQDHGFERSHVLDASGADNWEQKPYLPLYDTAPWWADGVPVTLPNDFYSSEYIVDRTIDLLTQGPEGKPFFAHVGFQAVHLPVQVGREWTDKYNGRFDAGWDELRRARAERVQALGILPAGAPVAAPPSDARSWSALGEDERALYARMMQVNAGMLEAMDFHLGRLLEHLSQTDQLDNTVVVVLSDNGPEYNELQPADHDRIASLWKAPFIERVGERGTTASIGPEWATVSSSPLSLFKFQTSEGGIRVPLIIAGPGVPATPVVHARAHVADILPTILDLLGVPAAAPPTALPLRGRSLKPALVGDVDEVYGVGDAVGLEVAGNAALFRGPYKLVKMPRPYGDAQWRLYDISVDPGETHDLSGERPELAAELREAYAAFAAQVGVVEMKPDYEPAQQVWENNTNVLLKKQAPKLVAGATSLIVVVVLAGRAWRRRRRAAA
jgi:arylsulfatase/uncharacterized sulfatase